MISNTSASRNIGIFIVYDEMINDSFACIITYLGIWFTSVFCDIWGEVKEMILKWLEHIIFKYQTVLSDAFSFFSFS